jgi:hypothetical protein
MTNASNVYRKVRALVAKTVSNGCTVGEAVNAANLASKIIAEQKLDPTRIDWPAAPTGYGWVGEPGRGGKVTEQQIEKRAKPTPKKSVKAKQPRFTNGERLAALAARPGGFTIEDIITMLGILPHTARALISVELRKRRGLKVEIDRETKRYRTLA